MKTYISQKTARLFFVLTLHLSLSLFAKAQDIALQSDTSEAVMLYEQLIEMRQHPDEYDSKHLREAYTKAVPIIIKALGGSDHRSAYVLATLGYFHREAGDIEASQQAISRAVEFVDKYKIKENAEQVYYAAADLESVIGNYNMAIEYCEKGLETAASPSLIRGQILNVQGITHMLMGNFDDAIAIFETYVENSKKREADPNEINRELALAYGNIGICYAETGRLLDAKNNFIDAMLFFKRVPSMEPQVISSLLNLAKVCSILQDFECELEYILEAKDWQLKTFGEEHHETVKIYQGIAKIYENNQDYNSALIYYRKALELAKKIFKEGEHVENAKYAMGTILQLMGEFEEANKLFLSTLSFHENGGDQYLLPLSNIYYELGTNYTRTNKYDKADFYLQKALEIKRKLRPAGHRDFGSIDLAFAENELVQNKPDKAQPHIQSALNLFLEKFGKNHDRSAEAQSYMAEYHYQKGNYDEAKKSIQSALEYLATNESNGENLEYGAYAKTQVVPAYLMAKAELFLSSFESNGDPDDLITVIRTVEEAMGMLETQRSAINNKNAQGAHIENFIRIYEIGIASQFKLNEANLSGTPHSEAFAYSEKIKSIALKENYSSSRAVEFSGVDTGLLRKQKELAKEIDFNEKIIFEEKEKAEEQNPTIIAEAQEKLFRLSVESDSLLEIIREKYPRYFQFKFENNTIPLENVQRGLLSTPQALIEYFTGDSAIYVFIITTVEYKIIEIEKDFPLQELVEQLQRKTYTCQLNGNCSEAEYQAEADTFSMVAHELYQRIFYPIEQVIELPEELIIIPDGVLGYIPFEMLMRERPNNSTSFSTHPYLLRDYQISYCYSATLLHEMKKMEKGKAEKDFLAFAPNFGNEKEVASANRSIEDIRSGLGALVHNVPEVLALQKIMGGEVFTGLDATEEAFSGAAPNYRILHLATHGKANDEMGDYAYLAFTEIPDSVENELLYNRDLYGLQLNADLVVLSACETGIGELQRGEGIISLARGFSYAGARSIVTTLWSINDQTTTELMKGFYTNLKNGMAKDAALRRAKLDYLDTHPNDEAHPFYWAAFVPIGDMAPVDLGGPAWWMWVLLGGILLAGVYFLRKKFSS